MYFHQRQFFLQIYIFRTDCRCFRLGSWLFLPTCLQQTASDTQPLFIYPVIFTIFPYFLPFYREYRPHFRKRPEYHHLFGLFPPSRYSCRIQHLLCGILLFQLLRTPPLYKMTSSIHSGPGYCIFIHIFHIKRASRRCREAPVCSFRNRHSCFLCCSRLQRRSSGRPPRHRSCTAP